MGFYQDQILPLVIDLAMRQRNLAAYRNRVVPAAEGCVLEIGIGSGRNLPFYSHKAERVIGLDPSPKLLSMARRAGHPNSGAVEFVEGVACSSPAGVFSSSNTAALLIRVCVGGKTASRQPGNASAAVVTSIARLKR